MSRLPLVDPESTSGRTRLLLDGLAKRRGRVSNMVRVMANSPETVNAFFSFNAALSSGRLTADLRERIAIAVAQANNCETCLAAHTAFGQAEGISGQELEAARWGDSANGTYQAALRFALLAISKNGKIEEEELHRAYDAGLDNGLLLEILATAYINAFTNAVNHLAETEPDYPRIV